MSTILALYHVSPMWNAPGIAHKGLLPEMATGALKVTWLLQHFMLTWGVVHVAMRHDVKIEQLHIYDVDVATFFLKRTKWDGVYTCNQVLLPRGKRLASEVLSPDDFG